MKCAKKNTRQYLSTRTLFETNSRLRVLHTKSENIQMSHEIKLITSGYDTTIDKV